MMFEKITNEELAKFLKEAATYFRSRDTRGEDAMHWANEANAVRCEIAADRLTTTQTSALPTSALDHAK